MKPDKNTASRALGALVHTPYVAIRIPTGVSRVLTLQLHKYTSCQYMHTPI